MIRSRPLISMCILIAFHFVYVYISKMPQKVRDFWLPRFRNFKVKFVFSSNSTEGRDLRAHATSVVMKKKKKKTERVEGVNH